MVSFSKALRGLQVLWQVQCVSIFQQGAERLGQNLPNRVNLSFGTWKLHFGIVALHGGQQILESLGLQLVSHTPKLHRCHKNSGVI